MSTHAKWLDMVKFSSPPGLDVILSKSIADKLHSGVFSMDGARLPSQHNTFVDDNLMVDTIEHI